MLALTINATAEKVVVQADHGDNEEHSQSNLLNTSKIGSAQGSRLFVLLDNENRVDQEMRSQLIDTVVELLSPNGSVSMMQAYGI